MNTRNIAGRCLKTAALACAVALTVLTVQAAPASAAEDPICGYQVGGDILAKYQSMGGQSGPLGCPTSDELATPNGRGRYNTFDGGSIYWTAATGAHPVWGAIRDKWAALGWETGTLGFPVSDELANPDGQGKRQQFEGGTVYWSAPTGAHPVWGKIGELWGQYGWERGEFGYPTSDEYPDPDVKGVRQNFSARHISLFWSPGMGGTNGTCIGECVGYQGTTDVPWVKQTKVWKALRNGDIDVMVYPTAKGFDDADTNCNTLWDQAWAAVPYPKGLTDTQGSSMYKQLACHSRYAYEWPNGSHVTGDSWDLESWRPDVSWDYALNPLSVVFHQCNWT
ncbi:DUF2599 domain-containing protein [Streptomyces sp. MMG1121]|uniref:DUF2599 domain-containing protein n=1 Tax=Streptomyces sp. MMG1121 TaxID=1415544 RepID=UPI000A543D20|nr:DUF2599 domain-containing protein [Streptomyces sp. MMG1121]